MRRWLSVHSIRTGEALAGAVGVAVALVLAIYQIVALFVQLPLLPPSMWLVVVCLVLLGMYVGAKWSLWRTKPHYRLSDRLELDSINHWRLTCWNDGPPCETRARIMNVTDRGGTSLVDPQHLPLEVTWTHQPGRPALGKQDSKGISFPVATYGWIGAGTGAKEFRALKRVALIVLGTVWKPSIGQISRFRYRDVFFDIAIDSPAFPHEATLERRFALRYDRRVQGTFRAEPSVAVP